MNSYLKYIIPFAVSYEIGIGFVYFLALFFPDVLLHRFAGNLSFKLDDFLILEFCALFFTFILCAPIVNNTQNEKKKKKPLSVNSFVKSGIIIIVFSCLIMFLKFGVNGAAFIFIVLSRELVRLTKDLTKNELFTAKSLAIRFVSFLTILTFFDDYSLSFGHYDERLNVQSIYSSLSSLELLNWGMFYFLFLGTVFPLLQKRLLKQKSRNKRNRIKRMRKRKR